MDLELKCNAISASHDTKKMIVSIEGANGDDILEHFNIKDIVAYFDVRSLLDEIGQDEAESHFDLIKKPEE